MPTLICGRLAQQQCLEAGPVESNQIALLYISKGGSVCWWVRSFQGGGGSSVGASLEETDNEEFVFEGDIYPWGFSPHLLLRLLPHPSILSPTPSLSLCKGTSLLCRLFPLPAHSAWLQAPSLLANHGPNETYEITSSHKSLFSWSCSAQAFCHNDGKLTPARCGKPSFLCFTGPGFLTSSADQNPSCRKVHRGPLTCCP